MDYGEGATIIRFPIERVRQVAETGPSVDDYYAQVQRQLEPGPATPEDIPTSPQPVELRPTPKYDPETDKLCKLRPEHFIDPVGEKTSERIQRFIKARVLCNACDIQVECLEGAIERREPSGVWGGEEFFKGKIVTGKTKRGRPISGFPID